MLPRQDLVIVLACVTCMTALAWGYLVHLDREMSAMLTADRMMADMGMVMNRPWTAADLLVTFVMWAVMMVGMMSASATPVLLLFGGALRGRGERRAWPSVALFGLGYLLVWCLFSGGAALLQAALHQAALLSPVMAAANPRLGGAILIGAGIYQLTPWKGACLAHCRSPLGFLMSHWRVGRLGALRMGVRHGWYCLGCCWALMCVLFVVGVMNLVWVAALSVFVLLEKAGPSGLVMARVSGALMLVAGLAGVSAR